jgi:hypothetical protein
MEDDEQTKQSLEAIYAKYPTLQRVDAALDAYFSGKPVTARCLICDEFLSVEYIEAIATTWVTCPNHCTVYHSQGTKTQ